MSRPAAPKYRQGWLWNFGFSAFWFATSYKWFILLLAVIPGQVEDIVPGGTKNTNWGMVYSVGAVWAVFGPALFGSLSDRLRTKWGHRRPFLWAGAALTVVALSVLSQATSLLQLTLGYLLLQIGDDLGSGPYGGMVAEMVPQDQRGRASSIMQVMQQAGNVLSAVTAIVLKRPELIYLSIGVLNVLCVLWTTATIRDIDQPPARRHKGRLLSDWLSPWKSLDFRRVYFAKVMNSLAFALISNYILYYLTDMFRSYKLLGIDFQDARSATFLIGVTVSATAVVGAVVSAKVSDKVGVKKMISIAGVVVFAILVPFALARNFDIFWGLAVPFGVALGMYVSCDWALASDVLPDKDRAGAQMGVWVSALTVVQIFVGQAGRGIDALNRVSMGLGYVTVIWLGGFLFVAGTLLNRSVGRSGPAAPDRLVS